MATAAVILAVLLVSWCSLLLLFRAAVRRTRRAGRRLTDRARTAALAHGVGPAAESARLRRELARSLQGARRALAAATAVGTPTGDCRSLLARLELAARSVDGELQVLEAHPDAARRGAALAGPRERAHTICTAAAELVDGLLQATGHDDEDLALLHTACAIEAEALRASRRPQVPS